METACGGRGERWDCEMWSGFLTESIWRVFVFLFSLRCWATRVHVSLWVCLRRLGGPDVEPRSTGVGEGPSAVGQRHAAGSMPEEAGGDAMGAPVTSEKSDDADATTAINVPRVNEVQLTAATGGAELSCYRCTVPFGVVVLIAGVVVTAVAYSFNSHGSTISYFGLVLLSAGLVLLASSAVCWRVRLERKKERRRESQTALVANQRSIFS